MLAIAASSTTAMAGMEEDMGISLPKIRKVNLEDFVVCLVFRVQGVEDAVSLLCERVMKNDS